MNCQKQEKKEAGHYNDYIPITELFAGLQPAFQHSGTGESHLACQPPGEESQTDFFTTLPDEWIVERDSQGNALTLHPDVVAGYWSGSRFIAMSELSSIPLDG